MYLYSLYADVTNDLFLEQFDDFVKSHGRTTKKSGVLFVMKDDREYADVNAWLEHAKGCGLVSDGKIER